jgi:predicted nuclease of predicted toxin-antitoxin system
MKFLIDAQLPKALANFFIERGFDAIHTLSLPMKNATPDNYVNKVSIKEKRVVISKDSDFYNTFLAKKEPYKLLYLSVGNMRNSQLLSLFAANFDIIIRELKDNDVVEMNDKTIIALI